MYRAGTSDNYLGGSLGIGSTTLTRRKIGIGGNTVGAGFNYGIHSIPVIQSDVTNYLGFNSEPSTQATSFTLTTLRHFSAIQGTFGIGSSVSVQAGFWANSSLTGATNNYGFYGDIAAATGRWNLYMNGTANNYMAGSLGIGTTNITNQNVFIAKTLSATGLNFAVSQVGIVQSAATSAFGFYNSMQTQAASFTLSNYYHFNADQGTIGASSTVNNQYGFVYSSTATGATNNYAFRSGMASGTGRWNVYMDGTAANYLNGNTIIGGSAVDGGQKLQVNGDTLMKGSGATSATTGLNVQNSSSRNLIRLLNDSTLKLGNENIDIFPSANGSTVSVNGRGLIISTDAQSQTTGAVKIVGSSTYTSGNDWSLWLSHSFAPQSGTSTHSGLLLNQTINQTGGANGITRGLYINPTLTAAADWRSIETSNNSGWAAYFAGSADLFVGDGADIQFGATNGTNAASDSL